MKLLPVFLLSAFSLSAFASNDIFNLVGSKPGANVGLVKCASSDGVLTLQAGMNGLRTRADKAFFYISELQDEEDTSEVLRPREQDLNELKFEFKNRTVLEENIKVCDSRESLKMDKFEVVYDLEITRKDGGILYYRADKKTLRMDRFSDKVICKIIEFNC